jgi:GTPase SAR1 family protein
MSILPTKKSVPEFNLDEYTYLIYGEPKVGKTTFASHFPNAIFLATEAGHKFIECFKVDINGDIKDESGKVVKKVLPFEHFKLVCRDLIKAEHEYKTVVIDTADNLYIMAAKSVCRKMGIEHESDADFGKAYSRIKEEIMTVIHALTQHGLGVVFISHVDNREVTISQTISDGNGEHITAEVTKKQIDATLSGSAKKLIRGLCDMIFYCYIDDKGKRWFRTKQNESIVAGDRSGKLPPIMPLSYTALEKELKKQKDKK